MGDLFLPKKQQADTSLELLAAQRLTLPSASTHSSYEGTIKTNPMQLAHTALSVTLDSACSTSTPMKDDVEEWRHEPSSGSGHGRLHGQHGRFAQ
ncbi:uncharacterized protein A4U43_C04F35650 [Asparagus officinalis]|uniref:Uncharacterized protein n=1 Tax=Asparagus officinalis TaxID=4686 RepID=A0A5P1F7U5_ASPOF|nr:uncharacterized protein A4U43_C04F35650 [Asparagus officinalis]